ncbi:hypothetical protein J4052_28440 [Bacillus toyonensis]|nr:hypothetical protein [Bacillus toyonensis]
MNMVRFILMIKYELEISAGLMYIRGFINEGGLDYRGWALEGPELLWAIWGLTLFGATIAYYYRRRGMYKYCKQL